MFCTALKRFFADLKMAAVFLAKPERRDHSPKREESIDVLFDPSYFSLDSPFNS